jgi:hypothetical protein
MSIEQSVPIDITDASGEAIEGLPETIMLRIPAGTASARGTMPLPLGPGGVLVDVEAIGIHRVDAMEETEVINFEEPVTQQTTGPTTGPTTQPTDPSLPPAGPNEPDFGGDDRLRDFFRKRRDQTKWPRDKDGKTTTVTNSTGGWIWVAITTDNLTPGVPRTPWYPLGPGETTPNGVDVDAVCGFMPNESDSRIHKTITGNHLTVRKVGGKIDVVQHAPSWYPDFASGQGWYPSHENPVGGHPNQLPPGWWPVVYPDWWPRDANGSPEPRNVVH